MRVRMFRLAVVVLVGVKFPVSVHVDVLVALPAQPAPDSPQGVGQPETGEQPGRQVAPPPLDNLQPADRHAGQDTHQAQDDGRGDMANAAKGGDQYEFFSAPFARLPEHHERKVVVGAGQGVDDAEAGRRPDQQRAVGTDHGTLLPFA